METCFIAISVVLNGGKEDMWSENKKCLVK